MTLATLRSRTCKDLAQLAKKRGVSGWHSMRKEQLVRALIKLSTTKSSAKNGKKPHGAVTAKGKSSTVRADGQKINGVTKKPNPRIAKKISVIQAKLRRAKDLATPAGNGKSNGQLKDRLVVMVRDPYWLHVYWELTAPSVSRAQAAMGQLWHTAKPQLRLHHVTNVAESASSETFLRSIDIHGGVSNWYIDVTDPPKSYRVEIGYESSDGTFFPITRSNIVSTPPAAARDAVDENWSDVAENFDRIYALSGGYGVEGSAPEVRELLEERLLRPMGSPESTRFGAGAATPLDGSSDFFFEADAELIVFGSTRPNAHVMLQGEPIQVRADGTFTVRMSLPDCRQVIPIVSSSADGSEQRTISLAIERNTKRMETIYRDTLSR